MPISISAWNTLLRQPCGTAGASCFFIGNQKQLDLAVYFRAAFLQCQNRIQHGYDSALHIAGAASKNKMPSVLCPELLLGLRGNYIMVSMEIQGARSMAVARATASRNFIRGARPRGRFKTAEFQAQLRGSFFENLNKLAIVPAWRILCRNSNEIR